GFQALVRLEATQVLDRLAGRPSTVVLCGNSEVEQQVAMLGLPPELGRDRFYGETLPALARAAGSDAIDVPSSPFGGDLPFRPDRGVANYYGVGGYRRPLSDARTSGVRFAAECLALANVPNEVPADIRDGVPRDVGSDWDFQDVRDHYLALLFEVDPDELRRTDRERYLELSRAVSGEVMAEVFGEWRRSGSPSGGGLVLWLRDLRPGSGWGLLDHRGEPKVAWHHLRRALAPTAVWTTDEGLGGVVVHVANDGPEPLTARLRVALYRDLEVPVGGGETIVELAPHGTVDHDVEGLIGHFVDAAWAYRFGPPAQDAIVATLERLDGPLERPLAQSVRLPAGRALATAALHDLGLTASVESTDGDRVELAVSSRRLAYGVRLDVPGFVPGDDAFAMARALSCVTVM
ncbi:MAG: glycoside hydrolase family 2 protein, partial [Candidatus Limnocylindrales bacterium]